LIPEDNNKDVEEIPGLITEATRFIPMSHMDQVLRQALVIADPDQFFARLAAHDLAQTQRTERVEQSGFAH
jgi:ATP-dependent Lon protease